MLCYDSRVLQEQCFQEHHTRPQNFRLPPSSAAKTHTPVHEWRGL